MKKGNFLTNYGVPKNLVLDLEKEAAKIGDVIPFLETPGGRPIGRATIVENTKKRVLVDIVLNAGLTIDDFPTIPWTSAEIRTSRRRRKKGRR